MKLFVLDPHSIYRRGLAASLSGLPQVEAVYDAASAPEARQHPALRGADVLIVDAAAPGARELAGAVHEETGARVVLCASRSDGAPGALCKETLTTEGLAAAIGAPSRGVARLTDREHRVLSLIAEGHRIREVAEQLCYSERTVKNVLHEVVQKLNARSRSQAVAHAVREGLI